MPDYAFSPKEREKTKIINEAIAGQTTNAQAAKLLNLSIRQIKRLKQTVRSKGIQTIVHGLKNKASNHHINLATKEQALSLIREKYTDFKPTFAAEKLAENHNLIMNAETLRLWLIEAKLWKARKQKSLEYHSWRERKEYFGELQQFDGSYHFWFEKRLVDNLGNPVEACLLASIDDATGKITHAVLDFNEGIVPVFNFWKSYVELLGKPLRIYLDKFSTYKINHKSAVDNTELMTQFQQAMKILDIEPIPANSPQAKGRVERLFQTLQDRLVKELRLANINTIDEGNKFLKEVFISKFNNQFSVIPQKQGNIHRQLSQKEKRELKSIFSIKSTRRINFDFTIQFKNYFYQLEEVQPITIRPKDQVLVEEHLNGNLHVRFKEHYLNYFILPKKPEKILKQPTILTNHPLNWKPPANHPWKKFKFGRG